MHGRRSRAVNEFRLRLVLSEVDAALTWLGKCEGLENEMAADLEDLQGRLGQVRTRLLGMLDELKQEERENV
jgi:hypothetical protein